MPKTRKDRHREERIERLKVMTAIITLAGAVLQVIAAILRR